jgi:threonine synthase
VRFVSTRGEAPAVGLSEAITRGVAPDGGLYLPDGLAALPALDPASDLAGFAAAMLAPFFAGDRLEPDLQAICAEAFDFPAPIVTPDPGKPGLEALELFHGPTGAFKDFGARFLTACFDRLGDPDERLHVLVATSGDTGGAVGCAAEGKTCLRASILYPRGRVSPFQELQLICWGKPVRAFEVDGDFDDCQRLVKAAFADPGLAAAHRLTSANSINIGRLLPQMAYLGHAALRTFAKTGVKPGFIVPTGNLGHGFAALYARALSLPLGPVLFVTNANRTLADWKASGVFTPRGAVATIANAMDVGAPSNFERLAAFPPDRMQARVELVEDGVIRTRIALEYRASHYVWCPHSATAAEAYARLREAERAERPWIACATAHPFKFAEIVEPLIGAPIEPPPPLAAILGREGVKIRIPATLDALAEALRAVEIPPDPSLRGALRRRLRRRSG